MKHLQMSTIATVGWKPTFDHHVFVYSLPSDGEISAYGALLPPLAGNQLLITVFCAGRLVTVKHLKVEHYHNTTGLKPASDNYVFICRSPGDGETSACGALLSSLDGNQLLTTVFIVQVAW